MCGLASCSNPFKKACLPRCKTLRGKGKLTEANMRDGLELVEQALLEADVNFTVVKEFMAQVTDEAVGEKVLKSLRPEPADRQHRLRRARRPDGAGRSLAPLQAGRHRPDALRPAGLRQDDHLRQARPHAQGARPQAAARRRRLAAPRRRRAAAGARRAARRPRLLRTRRNGPGRRLPERRDARPRSRVPTSSSSTPPAGCTSTTS